MLLLSTLRNSLCGSQGNISDYSSLNVDEWRAFFQLSIKQGVVAIVYDVISKLPPQSQPPRDLKLNWAISVAKIESRYKQQFIIADQLCTLWASQGIRTVVMKGFSLSRYYPNPKHRECGDFDCYLLDGRYEDGNIVAEQNGARVNREWYKHSQIFFRGLMVENHRFITTTRKGQEAKQLHAILDKSLNENELTCLDDTRMLLPPPLFTALFVTYHSFSHFISEGITLRYFYDWACFIKNEQNNIDWNKYLDLCNKFKFNTFADVSNEVITKYLGIILQNNNIPCESAYTRRVLVDTIYSDAKVFSSRKGKWYKRFKIIANIFTHGWKYSDIAGSNSLQYLWDIIGGYIFKRED